MRTSLYRLFYAITLLAVLIFWRQGLDILTFKTNAILSAKSNYLVYFTDPIYIVLRFFPLIAIEFARQKFFSNEQPGQKEFDLRVVMILYFYFLLGEAALRWVRPMLGDPKPLLEMPLVASVVYPVVILFVTNFVLYWVHRAQHRVPFLWRYHKVHHSITRLNSMSIYNHFSEHFIGLGATFLVSMFFPRPLNNFFIVYALSELIGPLIHTSTKGYNFGILRFVIADSAYHRAHHLMRKEYFGKNLAFFPIFDLVFGTYVAPKEEFFDGPFGVENEKSPGFREIYKFY